MLVKESQNKVKECKSKYKQTAINLKMLKLEHERATATIKTLTENQTTLEDENKNLTQQYSYLETKYNEKTIESMQTIKDLEDELTMMQELNSNKEDSSDVISPEFAKENEKSQLTELLNERKCEEEVNNHIDPLQFKLEQYTKEISELNLQVKKIISS